MELSTLHILCIDDDAADKVKEAVKSCDVIIEHWEVKNRDSVSLHYLANGQDQKFYDMLRDIAEREDSIRLIEQPVDASFPKDEKDKKKEEEENTPGFFDIISREEIVSIVSRQARFNGSFLLLVAISAVVASIALIEGNIPILIGAMVLTPLLGPNLALAISSATADIALAKRAALCGGSGFLLTFISAYITGIISGMPASESMAPMFVAYGFETIPIAMCAGLAATVLLLQGTLSSLIGVMVAVAFLPPLAMTGLALSAEEYDHSISALLLFAVNVASFNLASKTVLLLAGIRPHHSDDNGKSFRALFMYITAWVAAIGVLSVGIYFK